MVSLCQRTHTNVHTRVFVGGLEAEVYSEGDGNIGLLVIDDAVVSVLQHIN